MNVNRLGEGDEQRDSIVGSKRHRHGDESPDSELTDTPAKIRRRGSEDEHMRYDEDNLPQGKPMDSGSVKTKETTKTGHDEEKQGAHESTFPTGLPFANPASLLHPSHTLDSFGAPSPGMQPLAGGPTGTLPLGFLFPPGGAPMTHDPQRHRLYEPIWREQDAPDETKVADDSRRTALAAAQQQLLAAHAAAQLRQHQQAMLLHSNPATAALISRGRGGANVLASLQGFNHANHAALLFPHGLTSLPPSMHPHPSMQQVSHQRVADRAALLGAAWGPAGAPSSGPAGADRKQQQQHPSVDLYMRCDDELLSDHQILVRKQIEYFEAGPQEVQSVTHGRRREIHIGQVGIRCKHCAVIPPRTRAKGAVYYPASLRALYQAAQNMAASHFTMSCEMIGADLKEQFQAFQGAKASAGHGGKKYWSDCAKAVGIVETDKYLLFKK